MPQSQTAFPGRSRFPSRATYPSRNNTLSPPASPPPPPPFPAPGPQPNTAIVPVPEGTIDYLSGLVVSNVRLWK